VSAGQQSDSQLDLQRALVPALDLEDSGSDSGLADALDVLADVLVIAAHLDGYRPSSVKDLGAPSELTVSLTQAWALHGRSADEDLAELVRRDVGGGRGVMPLSWSLAGPRLSQRLMRLRDPTMRPNERLRWRSTTRSRRPRRDGFDQSRQRGRCCPEALWPDWTIRLMPANGVSPATFRVGAAAALRLPGTSTPLGDLLAGTCHDGLKAKVSHTLGRLGAEDQTFAVLRALTALADGLDSHGSPIDYDRRRRLASSVELLSARDWDRICAHAGAPTGGDRKLANARLWLYESLTGGLPGHGLQHLLPHAHGPVAYHRFALRLPHRAADLLDCHAASILSDLDIDEPLSWSPPRDWVEVDGLPGPEPDDIDPKRVTRLLQDRIAPGVVATDLGISLEHVRHVVRHHPPQVHVRAEGPFRNRLPLPTELTPERLRQLVVTEGQGLRVVGREFGVDRKSIAAALEREGIPVGPVGRRRTAIDPDWFRTQYVDRRRSLPELAREIGSTPTTLARAANAYGITLRERGGASHARSLAAPDDALPSPLAEALVGQGGQGRVRRYQVLARSPSIWRAAATIGCAPATLHVQLARLERACGGLVVRSTRSHQSQRLTPAGQTLLDQADQHFGRPPSVLQDVPEPLASALASFGGEGRLRRFLDVADAESIGQAARLLGVHQTRLSKQVLGLEACCGGPLLHRCVTPASPQRLTALGRCLVEQAIAHPQLAG